MLYVLYLLLAPRSLGARSPIEKREGITGEGGWPGEDTSVHSKLNVGTTVSTSGSGSIDRKPSRMATPQGGKARQHQEPDPPIPLALLTLPGPGRGYGDVQQEGTTAGNDYGRGKDPGGWCITACVKTDQRVAPPTLGFFVPSSILLRRLLAQEYMMSMMYGAS